jgi:hypothetical protein
MDKIQVRGRMAQVLAEIHADVMREANQTYGDCRAYAEHVWQGGDPTVIAEFRSEFQGASAYADEIVNSCREVNGQHGNPFHPKNAFAFRLFDMLLSAAPGWVPAQDLRRITGGGHATTYLKDYKLRSAGWQLEKESFDGVVHYRLVNSGDNA